MTTNPASVNRCSNCGGSDVIVVDDVDSECQDCGTMFLRGMFFDMDKIVSLLHSEHGITDAAVDHTGGNTYTIFAGRLAGFDPQRAYGNWGALAGPGYPGPRGTHRGHRDEFAAGPDTDGVGYVDLADCLDEAAVAARMAQIVATSRS